jgi:hypothetical protein
MAKIGFPCERTRRVMAPHPLGGAAADALVVRSRVSSTIAGAVSPSGYKPNDSPIRF